jgi:predicted regulator of Ras-like GTPase activity (Roadblock/LC7/MglB family)
VTFGERLDRVLGATPGAISVTLMGFDGIAIESKTVDTEGDAALACQASAVELGTIAGQLKRMSESLGTGPVEEVMLQTGDLVTVLRPLTEDYFVALSMRAGGLVGKGRYLVRLVGSELTTELT